MRRIAVATSASDPINFDPDAATLLGALSGVGLEGEMCVWDSAVDWNGYDLVVIRSTWDYTYDRASYLEWARGIERLWNPYPIIAYSTDKHYLADLERRGHRTVPTTFFDVGSEPTFPDTAFVVKPTVGAGSRGADKFDAHEHERARLHVQRLHASGRDVMVQPYVPSIDEAGERALVFIDGMYSHAITKGVMLHVPESRRDAVFRRKQITRASSEPDALDFATATLADDLFAGLLYARVDLARVADGWAIMELELVEPSLFLTYDDEAPRRLAEAIRSRLD